MSNPDKHHYLPVFFLKRWARPDGKVYRYHRPMKNVVVAEIAPKNTGFEHGLYALDGVKEDQRNFIESSFMSSLDSHAARALDVLLENGPTKLTDEQRKAWTHFVMSLHVRNPARVEHITKDVAERVRNTLRSNPHEYDEIRKESDPKSLLEWVEQKAPHIVSNYGKGLLPGIIQHPHFVNEIIQMAWCILDLSPQPLDLVTSDRPLILCRGISDPGCLMALAISPARVFLATRQPSLVESVLRGTLKDMAKTINDWTVQQADSVVYAMTDDHLRFVENRLGIKHLIAKL